MEALKRSAYINSIGEQRRRWQREPNLTTSSGVDNASRSENSWRRWREAAERDYLVAEFSLAEIAVGCTFEILWVARVRAECLSAALRRARAASTTVELA